MPMPCALVTGWGGQVGTKGCSGGWFLGTSGIRAAIVEGRGDASTNCITKTVSKEQELKMGA